MVAIKKGLFEAVLNESVEPALAKYPVPVILQDYPAEMAALARLKKEDPGYAERFELYLCRLS